MSLLLGYDPTTLRERVDLLEVGHRLSEIGEMRSLDALCERVWLLKVTDRLDEALDVANQAYRLARFTGDRQDIMRPRILRATILQYQAHYDEAIAEYNACVDEAHIQEWEAYEALALHHRGTTYFDQALYAEALADFRAAAFLRQQCGASADDIELSQYAANTADALLNERPQR